MRVLSLPIVLSAVLLTSVAAGGLPRTAQTPGSSVLITQCNVRDLNNVAESNFRVTPYKSGQQAMLSIDYQNQAPIPIAAIVFGIVSVGKLVGVGQDSGRFSQGVQINHQLILSGPPISLDTQTHCTVLRALFENGAAWFNPSPPQW